MKKHNKTASKTQSSRIDLSAYRATDNLAFTS
jgi:hypothetical protein